MKIGYFSGESLEVALSCIILTISGIFLTVYYFWTWNYNYWKDNNVPYIQPTFPFGNVKDFVLAKKYNGSLFKEIYNQFKGLKYGGIINIRTPWLIIKDPEIIKQILTRDFSHFTDRGFPLHEEHDSFSANLFFLRRDRWKPLRMKLSPTFSNEKMKVMFHLIKHCANELEKTLSEQAEKQNVIELTEFMTKYSTTVIGSCAFGLEMDSRYHKGSKFYALISSVITRNLGLIMSLNSLFPGINRILRMKITPTEVGKMFSKIVSDTISYRERNQIKRHDFLDLLIKLKNENNSINFTDKVYAKPPNDHNLKYEKGPESSNSLDFTDEFLTAQCVVFFLAGFFTTSLTLSFCLYELAINTLIQEKVQNEIDSVLDKHKGVINYESLLEMKYLDMVIKETLRKHPPVSTLIRECTSDYKLESKIGIRKGMIVVIPLLGLHYDLEFYPDPNRFDPDRFTEEAIKSRHHYAWLPFGGGPRICIGMKLGFLQMKTGLVSVLSKYKFSVCQETQIPIEFKAQTLLAPKEGIKLKISKRIN